MNQPIGINWQPGKNTIQMNPANQPPAAVAGGPTATKVLALNIPNRPAPNSPVPQSLLTSPGSGGTGNFASLLQMIQRALVPTSRDTFAGSLAQTHALNQWAGIGQSASQPIGGNAPAASPDPNPLGPGTHRIHISVGGIVPNNPGAPAAPIGATAPAPLPIAMPNTLGNTGGFRGNVAAYKRDQDLGQVSPLF